MTTLSVDITHLLCHGHSTSQLQQHSYKTQAIPLGPGTSHPAQCYSQPPVIECLGPGIPKQGAYTTSIHGIYSSRVARRVIWSYKNETLHVYGPRGPMG